MSVPAIKQTAARSAARAKKRKETSPPPPAPPSPEGVIKTTPGGKVYRLYTIPVMDYPAFLEREKLDPKGYFHYPPEEDKTIPQDTPENRLRRYRSGFVLGVRRDGETEDREL